MPLRQQKQAMLPVKNARLVETALRTTENLLEVNRANARNAIEATGYPVTVYNRLTQGRRCTCSHQRQQLLDEQGNLSTGMIETLVTGIESSIEEYGDPQYKAVLDSGRLETIDARWPNNAEDIKDTTINLAGGEGDPAADDHQALSIELNLDDFDNEPNRLFIATSTSCGVCFGTSFVGGYEPLFGNRSIYDATHDHEMYNCELDILAAPNIFNVFDEGHVVFPTILPAASSHMMLPAVYNNKEQIGVENYVLEISADRNTWEEASASNVLALSVGSRIWLRITSAEGTTLRFTHIEILSSHRPLTEPFKADFPDVNKGVNLTLADYQGSCNIIIPGDLMLNRWSVVIDHLPGLSRHWMVNTIQPRRDQFGNVYDTSLDSRVMDLNELGQLLRPLSNHKEPLV